jgi:hypothetical protein
MFTEAEHLAQAQRHCTDAAKLLTAYAARAASDESMPQSARLAMLLLAQVLAGQGDDGMLVVFERLKTIPGLQPFRTAAAAEVEAAVRSVPCDHEVRESFYCFIADLLRGDYDNEICRLIRGGEDPAP